MQHSIVFDGPVLPGSVTAVWSRCGKPRCACRGRPHRLHGPYYRWTGYIGGKRTTRTIGRKAALECQRRIRRYRVLERRMKKLLRVALAVAPWMSEFESPKKRRKNNATGG
jgi:hypothetical protein